MVRWKYDIIFHIYQVNASNAGYKSSEYDILKYLFLSFSWKYALTVHIMKTLLFKYTENFTTKQWQI